MQKIEENNKMGKTRDLIKQTGDTKGTLHAKMGTIKYRNGRDLTEAEDIMKRWQEYTENIQKRSSWPRSRKWYDNSCRARHPEIES